MGLSKKGTSLRGLFSQISYTQKKLDILTQVKFSLSFHIWMKSFFTLNLCLACWGDNNKEYKRVNIKLKQWCNVCNMMTNKEADVWHDADYQCWHQSLLLSTQDSSSHPLTFTQNLGLNWPMRDKNWYSVTNERPVFSEGEGANQPHLVMAASQLCLC